MTPLVARVGLEVHVRLATGRRLFTCSGIGHGDGAPNRGLDAFVLAEPGTLPVLDHEAVELAGRAAAALGASVHPVSGFDRKHYVYRDLPRGYQITQQATPFATGGTLEAPRPGEAEVVTVEIDRLHLEDDAGRTVRQAPGVGVDLARAGGALIEVVTTPTLRDGADAEAALRELHAVLVAAGVTRGALETGDLRCDANVSVAPADAAPEAVPRVELKNLNSFRHVRRAVDHELGRQRARVKAGDAVTSETRRWTGTSTEPTRTKRAPHAYGWLPEPDLPPIRVSDGDRARWRAALPELPAAARMRLVARGLRPEHAADLVGSPSLRAAWDEATGQGADPTVAARWALGPFAAAQNEGVAPDGLGSLLAAACAAERDATYTVAQLEAAVLVALRGGLTLSDALSETGAEEVWTERRARAAVATVLASHPGEVARYRAGKRALLGFFMGAVRNETAGAVAPATTRALLEEMLDD